MDDYSTDNAAEPCPSSDSPKYHGDTLKYINDRDAWDYRERKRLANKVGHELQSHDAGFVWLTATEAATYIGVTPRTVTNWLREGTLTTHDERGTRHKFSRAELDIKKAAQTCRFFLYNIILTYSGGYMLSISSAYFFSITLRLTF